MTSKLEQARNNIAAANQERTQTEARAKEMKAADRIVEGIHADGMALMKHSKSLGLGIKVTPQYPGIVGRIQTRIAKFLSTGMPTFIETPVFEEGQLSVLITVRANLDEIGDEYVYIGMEGLKQALYTRRTREGVVNWHINNVDDNNRQVPLRDYQPLEEAREWRTVMDIVLGHHPLPQLPSPHNNNLLSVRRRS